MGFSPGHCYQFVSRDAGPGLLPRYPRTNHQVNQHKSGKRTKISPQAINVARLSSGQRAMIVSGLSRVLKVVHRVPSGCVRERTAVVPRGASFATISPELAYGESLNNLGQF